MNKARRKEIQACIDRLNDIKSEIGQVNERIENIRDEEQESFDNLPEGIQDGERGEAMQEAIDNLESVDLDLDSEINDAIEYLENAMSV